MASDETTPAAAHQRELLREAHALLDQGIAWSPQGKHHFWVKKVVALMARIEDVLRDA